MLRLTTRLLALLVLCLLTSSCQPPEKHFTDQYDQPITLSEHWLVINYWATWCKPCRKEVPELNQLHNSLKQQNIQVVGVNYDQLKGNTLIEASNTLGISFPVLAQDPASAFALPSSQGLPVTHIVNPSGKYVATLLGEQTAASVHNRLVQLGALAH